MNRTFVSKHQCTCAFYLPTRLPPCRALRPSRSPRPGTRCWTGGPSPRTGPCSLKQDPWLLLLRLGAAETGMRSHRQSQPPLCRAVSGGDGRGEREEEEEEISLGPPKPPTSFRTFVVGLGSTYVDRAAVIPRLPAVTQQTLFGGKEVSSLPPQGEIDRRGLFFLSLSRRRSSFSPCSRFPCERTRHSLLGRFLPRVVVVPMANLSSGRG